MLFPNFKVMPSLRYEVKYKTARSGGKGGQNVNKVETMAEVYWHVYNSELYTEDEKNLITEKLANKINAEGFLIVKSQKERSQLANKQDALQKMEDLVTKALHVPKKRKPTRVSKAAKQKRLDTKQRNSGIKEMRKKPIL